MSDTGESLPEVTVAGEQPKRMDEKVPEVIEAQPENRKSLADLRMGYVVGVTPEGNFIFEVVGQDQGLVELLGLHKFAEAKVNNILDANQNQGDALQFEIAKSVKVLAQEVVKLATALKKPDNNIKR